MYEDRSSYDDYEIAKLEELDKFIGMHENLKLIVESKFSEADKLKYLCATGFKVK